MKNIRVITISEGAAGMKSQIHGLANFINPNFQNFDIEIKALFKNLPIQLIPTNEFAYKNLDEIKINDKTIIISCGKKSVKASIILKKKVYNYYIIKQKNLDKNKFKNDFEILSVLRNLKIIGIFTRLALRDGKKKYLKMIPYAWNLINLRTNDDKIFQDLKDLLKINFEKKIK